MDGGIVFTSSHNNGKSGDFKAEAVHGHSSQSGTLQKNKKSGFVKHLVGFMKRITRMSATAKIIE